MKTSINKSKLFKTAWKNYNDQDWQSVKRFGHKTFGECLKSAWDFYKNNYGVEKFKLVGGTIERETEKAILFNAIIGFNKQVWLPKSQIKTVKTEMKTITYALPVWLWNQKAA